MKKFRKGIRQLLLCASLTSLVGATAREYPPSAPPPKSVTLPAPAVSTLSNGLKVVVVERHSLPLVTLRLVVKAGAEADPPEFPGTAQLVAALLTEGTSRRSAQQIAEAVDTVGGTIDSGADWDDSFLTLSVLTDHTELAFDLVFDMVIHPAFADAEIERKRKQTLSALEVARDDPAYLADTAFRWAVFSGTSYSHPEDGTAEAVQHLNADSLRAFHRRFFRPSNSILAVVGDISAHEAFNLAGQYFGDWKDQPAIVAASPTQSQSGTPQVIVIDKPDAVQTEIRVGNLGIPRDSSDFYALSVANQILGGPAANRLFRTLRSRQGLTYGASSDLICYRGLGGWVAKTFTRTPETIKTVEMTLEQMKRLRQHPISQAELESARGYLIGHMALDFETSEGIATQILDLMLHNLPLDYWNHFPERIQALETDDVWNATRRYLDPEHSVIVLVGNAAAFRRELKKLGAARVIPLRSVDFASSNLERTQTILGKQ